MRDVIVTLFARRNDTNGRRKESSWQELSDAITTPEIAPTKDGACFLFGEVRPDSGERLRHRKDQVIALYALGIDIDDVSADAVTEALADLAERGLDFSGWPTFSELAQPEEGSIRCRLLFPLSRPVAAKDWPRFWDRAVAHLGLKGLADPSCKDASRLFFHTCPDGKLREFRQWCDLLSNDGAALDVDAILAADPNTTPLVDLDAKEIVDGGANVPRCPLGRTPFEHGQELCRTMPQAISGKGGHVATLRLARALRWGLQLSEEQSFGLLAEFYNGRCEPPWSDVELAHKVATAGNEAGASYTAGSLLPPTQADLPSCVELLSTDNNGKVLDTSANVATILQFNPDWAGVLRYDAFACRVICAAEPPMREQDKPNTPCAGAWTDSHTTRARMWIADQYGFEPGIQAIESAIEVAARRNTFHPVKEYLAALVWDGKPRLDRFLATYFGAAASPYAAAVGAKFLISAVARAIRPGSKVDTCLILEGRQGSKKSTAVRTLAGEAWFADTPLDLETKDAAQSLQGKWLYEIGELHAFNRSETTRIKAFVSSASDNFRPSYGRRNADFPRQCVFVGTTNGSEYLTDTTGNRRFWPVACGKIDVGALARDRDQLWAEAVVRFNAGEPWWLDADGEALATAEQADREAADPWEAAIEKWIGERESFAVSDVLQGLGVDREHQTQAQATRVGKLLARLGWEAKRKRSGEGSTGDGTRLVRVYVRRAVPPVPA